jgi:hypothetical protein
MAGTYPGGRPRRTAHLRRIDGEDVVFRAGEGFRWVELAEGYRVRFQRARGVWEARRGETGARIGQAASLEEAYRRARRHYEALEGPGSTHLDG